MVNLYFVSLERFLVDQRRDRKLEDSEKTFKTANQLLDSLGLELNKVPRKTTLIKAFRSLSLKWHPDKQTDTSAESLERCNLVQGQINEAKTHLMKFLNRNNASVIEVETVSSDEEREDPIEDPVSSDEESEDPSEDPIEDPIHLENEFLVGDEEVFFSDEETEEVEGGRETEKRNEKQREEEEEGERFAE